MTCQAVPPGQATPGCYCTCCNGPARVPGADWIATVRGTCVRQGFVRDARFGPNDLVIPGTDRAKSRAFRRARDRT
jgi:hypothetical protein